MHGGFPDTPDRLEALAFQFQGRPVGHTIVWKDSTGSTMDDARQLAAEGAPAGTVIGADSQSSGRGRHGRGWVSKPGEDLLFSLVLRPEAGMAGRLSMLAGLGVARAVDRLAGRRSGIKWPNDVRVGGRKVCGVLVETALEGPTATAVIGFGLNVNMDPAGWPELADTATSLAHVCGRPQSRVSALQTLLEELDGLYQEGLASDRLLRGWAERVETIGRRVELVFGSELVHGLAEGVDYDGSLLVREQGGRMRKFAAGEVTVQSPR